MFDRLIRFFIQFSAHELVREEARLQGLRAVRQYISAIAKLRLGLMALFGLIALIALTVGGVLMITVGVISLLPVEPRTQSWSAIVIGAVLLLVGIFVYRYLFLQRRWLEMSRSYELMDVVIHPSESATEVPVRMARALRKTQDDQKQPMRRRAPDPRQHVEPTVAPV